MVLSSSLKILMEDYITGALKILFKVVMQKNYINENSL